MSNEKEAVKEKSSGRNKAVTIIGIILCVILVPILVVNVTMIIKSYTNPDEYPSFAGYNLMIVLSPSMEDTIMTGDLIVVKNADPAAIKGESSVGAGDGDIISFFDPDSQTSAVLTHRCVEVTTDADGNLAFKTKGDNNDSEDPSLAPAANLIGTYITRIPSAGNIAMWLQTTPGLIVCVAVPIVLLVAYDLIMKRRYDKSKKKDTDALLAELEALRAQQAAAQTADALQNAPADTVSAVPAAPAPAAVPAADAPASAADAPVNDAAHIDELIDEITKDN